MAEIKTEPVLKAESEEPSEEDIDKKTVKDKSETVTNGVSVKVEYNGKEEKSDESKIMASGSDIVSDLESKIIEQIEYYFGDCNLPRDKFLQQQIKLDDGWVPLEVMTKFNRLAKLSSDISVIASALKKSKKGLLEVSDDSKKIRRSPSQALPEMNEARRHEVMLRTLYVKGFPAEGVELDDLLQYFAKHTKLQQLIMRKYFDKAEKKWVFKGSVFAVFPSKEEAENFLKIENLKYKDADLIIKWQKDYVEDKKNERLQSKLESQIKKRKIKEEHKNEEDGEEDKKDALARGAALYLSDCPSELTREEIKSKIEELGIAVAYLYFNKGEKEGWVRLQEADSAAEVIKNLKEGKLEFENYNVSVRALEGEEEEAFLVKVTGDMAKRRNHNKNFKGKKGRGGGGGGNSFKRKWKGNPSRHESSPKKVAIAAKSD